MVVKISPSLMGSQEGLSNHSMTTSPACGWRTRVEVGLQLSSTLAEPVTGGLGRQASFLHDGRVRHEW